MSTTMSRVDLARYCRYRVTLELLDRLPIGTFFARVRTAEHTLPGCAMRLVKPNDASRYSASQISPGGRLLYYFWRDFQNGSEAVCKLGQASIDQQWNWVVQPGQPGYDLLDTFKIACDHRRGQTVSPALLYKALGLDNVSQKSIV